MKLIYTILTSVVVAMLASYGTVKLTRPQNASVAIENRKESAYERVMRTGILRCGYGISPPALIKDINTGEISGLDYDIIEAIGKQLNVKIEWTEEAGWGNFIEGLRSNRYDAFCTRQWPDEARARFQTLTDPVIYSFLYAYVRKDDHRFDNNLDAIKSKGIKIPAIDGDVSLTLAKTGFPEAGILTLPQGATLSDMLLSVKTGKADVVFLEPAMFETFDKENRGFLRQVENVDPSFTFASYYGFNTGEIQIRDMIDIALRTLIDTGQLEKIARRYSSSYIIARKNYEDNK